MRKIILQVLISLLFFDAVIVAMELLTKEKADWRKIALYWVLLSCKNGVDWLWKN